MRCILQWAGHVERMADERLPKRAAELREQDRRRRGRPRLRWEDGVKRDLKNTGEEGDWKKKTGDRGGWRRIADEAVKSCRQHLTPDKWKKRKREILTCSKEQVEEKLESRIYALERRRMKVDRRNTEYMCVMRGRTTAQGEYKKRWRKWMISNTRAQLYKTMQREEEKYRKESTDSM